MQAQQELRSVAAGKDKLAIPGQHSTPVPQRLPGGRILPAGNVAASYRLVELPGSLIIRIIRIRIFSHPRQDVARKGYRLTSRRRRALLSVPQSQVIQNSAHHFSAAGRYWTIAVAAHPV